MDSAWAHKRRTRLNLILGGFAILLLTIYITVGMYRPPSCFDGKRNQDEVGIDCGGTCDLFCSSQIQTLTTTWVRPFEVSPGWWSALAYVQNPNLRAYTGSAPYVIELVDRDGNKIAERSGETFINGDTVVPVFEGRFNVGSLKPYRALFSWGAAPVWLKRTQQYRVEFEEQHLVPGEFIQELQVMLVNKEPVILRNIEVVAILYDASDNAVAASKTTVDTLGPRDKRRIVFSWPQPFSAPVGRIEFLPRIPLQEG